MSRTIRFRFDTDTTRRLQEVQQYYLDNDGFVAEHRKRVADGFRARAPKKRPTRQPW